MTTKSDKPTTPGAQLRRWREHYGLDVPTTVKLINALKHPTGVDFDWTTRSQDINFWEGPSENSSAARLCPLLVCTIPDAAIEAAKVAAQPAEKASMANASAAPTKRAEKAATKQSKRVKRSKKGPDGTC